MGMSCCKNKYGTQMEISCRLNSSELINDPRPQEISKFPMQNSMTNQQYLPESTNLFFEKSNLQVEPTTQFPLQADYQVQKVGHRKSSIKLKLRLPNSPSSSSDHHPSSLDESKKKSKYPFKDTRKRACSTLKIKQQKQDFAFSSGQSSSNSPEQSPNINVDMKFKYDTIVCVQKMVERKTS